MRKSLAKILATCGLDLGSMRIARAFTSAAVMMFALTGSAQAADFIVTHPFNQVTGVCISGVDCSLRQAVTAADALPGDDTISFAASLDGDVIQSPNAPMLITSSDAITINGHGANRLTITGFSSTQLFVIEGGTVTINDMTLVAARNATGDGGAIAVRNTGTTLNLNRCRINNSRAFRGGGLAAFLGAVVNINDSTVDNNSSTNEGGGITVSSAAMVNIINSTISGNTTGNTSLGGGIFVSTSAGIVNITNSTITENRGANFGGGIFHANPGNAVNVRNSIIAGNFRPDRVGDKTPDVDGVFVSQGFNLIGSNSPATPLFSGFANGVNNDLVGPNDGEIDAKLAPLADNGGSTPTFALQPTSPAIDAGNDSVLTTDQRGLPRPVDRVSIPNALGSNGADIGAYESQAPTAAGSDIAGTITKSDGMPLGGVVVHLNGSTSTFTITDAAGHYSFADLDPAGFYTVTPQLVNYGFLPGARSFSLVGNTTEALFTATPDDVARGNPLDTPEYFVRQQYLDFLGREPDQAGLKYWSDQINTCHGDAGCLRARRINVSAAFFLSIEFQNTGYLVYRINQTSFATGETLAMNTLLRDTQDIGRGVVVGAPGWEAKLETNKRDFLAHFVGRPEFIAAYPLSLTPAQFVDALNANTKDPADQSSGGSLTPAERDQLVAELTAGTKMRAEVLRAVEENPVFSQRQFNRAFVYMQYVGYLRRNANAAPDTDFAGYNFWLKKLNDFNGNFIEAEMVKAFINSSEYRQRFAP